jgi:hypothetical protein
MAGQAPANDMRHVGTFIISYEVRYASQTHNPCSTCASRGPHLTWCNLLQELQGAFQQAAAALQTISTCLSQLQAPQASRQQPLPAVLTALHDKVWNGCSWSGIKALCTTCFLVHEIMQLHGNKPPTPAATAWSAQWACFPSLRQLLLHLLA